MCQSSVSAKFLERELKVVYQTAWSILHKLRHGLSEDPTQPLGGYLEADECYVNGRGDPKSPGRSTNNSNKSLVVLAVEKKLAPKNENGQHRHAPSASTGSTPAVPRSPPYQQPALPNWAAS